jgi:hypothetical protein
MATDRSYFVQIFAVCAASSVLDKEDAERHSLISSSNLVRNYLTAPAVFSFTTIRLRHAI